MSWRRSSLQIVTQHLTSTEQYSIGSMMGPGSCTFDTDLPVQPPVEVEKVWKFTKTETALIITCNNVEVLNYLFADSLDSSCVQKWGGDVVKEIKFDSGSDTASDFYRAEWTAVEREVKIPWDLKATPLQIKTDSTLDSGEKIKVEMYDKDSSYIGSVNVKFSSPMQYNIGYCTGWINLPVEPPVEADKIWTISKTGTGLIITSNNVEVTNYLFSDSSESSCVQKWGGDVVKEIIFSGDYDTASDFYNKAVRGGNGKYHPELEKKCNQPIPSPTYPKWSPETPKSFGRPGMKGRGSISGFTCMRIKYCEGGHKNRKNWSFGPGKRVYPDRKHRVGL
eukprot:sb/3466541/